MNYTELAFSLDEKQVEAIDKWIKELSKDKSYTGAIGGRFRYSFTPTTLGLVVKITDLVSNKELDVTDYESW
jgi:hypothetical protein